MMTASPRVRRWSATCEPTKPAPPVTSTFLPPSAGGPRRACRPALPSAPVCTTEPVEEPSRPSSSESAAEASEAESSPSASVGGVESSEAGVVLRSDVAWFWQGPTSSS